VSVSKQAQTKKAEAFLALHHAPELLVLPNIWNPLGARMLAGMGYPAVATASAAVAYSLGYDDGERIRFSTMLELIGSIASSVDVPLTADIEGGYAEGLDALTENVRQVIRTGAVGINLEDGRYEGGPLRPVEAQCDRIATARRAAELEGVPLVINARIDTFLGGVTGSRADKIAETVARGRSYLEAGADCLYPIGPGDIETLAPIRKGTEAPINVYAHAKTAPMRELEAAGISRLSLGPNLLKAAYTTLRDVARCLREYGSYESFTEGMISGDEILSCVSKDKMPG
jgi:2-methylisocitrate lyase-like PEP mutase family enzyme